jgi:ribonuclease HI
MMNFYRLHVPRFSEVLKLISEQMGNKKFVGSKECDEAVNEAKEIMASQVKLQALNPFRKVFLVTDASPFGWGAAVTHDPTGNEAPIAWLAGTFTKTESAWHQTERELFAVVQSLRRYPEFFGQHVTVMTDNTIVEKWLNMEISSGRLARWSETLFSHDLTFTRIPGKENFVADALSRQTEKRNEEFAGKVIPEKARTKTAPAPPPVPVVSDPLVSGPPVAGLIVLGKSKSTLGPYQPPRY